MRNTTNWGLTVPSSNTDPDAIPSQVGALADQIDALLAPHKSGTIGARPSAGHPNTYYYVTSGASIGSLFRDNGTSWDVVEQPGTSGDTTTAAFGDSAGLGATGRWADAAHRHGMMVNPLTAHLAASDPHPQYDTAAELVALRNTTSGNISASAPGDVKAAGSIGVLADAGHVHGREAYGLSFLEGQNVGNVTVDGGTLHTIALTPGTWIITVSAPGISNGGSSESFGITATGGTHTTVAGAISSQSTVTLNAYYQIPLVLTFKAVVSASDHVTISANLTGANAQIGSGSGYTAFKVA